jgi:hypothetical protein
MPRSSLPSSCTVLLLGCLAQLTSLGTTLAAQTAPTPLMLPASMAGVEGSAYSPLPFGVGSGVRYQILYQGVHVGGKRSFTELAFRADFNGGKAIAGKQYVWINARLMNVPLRWDQLSTDFDENAKSNVNPQVMNGRLSLPALGAIANGPRPFDVVLKFDQPEVFAQDWSEGNILIDLFIQQQPSGAYPLDSCFVCESKRTQFGKLEPSCSVQHPSGPLPLLIDAGRSTNLGRTMRFTGSNALPDAALVFFVGSLVTGQSWAGHQLPFTVHELFDPARVNPDPAPGCYINTDWLFIIPRVANSSGTASTAVPIPTGERWLNLFLTCQAMTMDLRANPMGFVFSKAVQSNVCGPLPVSVAFATFNDPNKPPSSGTVMQGEAPVIELR